MFKLGDKVEVKPAASISPKSRLHYGPLTVNHDQRNSYVSITNGRGESCLAYGHKLQLVTPEQAPSRTPEGSKFKSKHYFICVLDANGQPIPAERPKTYSQMQAMAVAKSMAAKHGGTFAVYGMEAVSEMPVEPTLRVL